MKNLVTFKTSYINFFKNRTLKESVFTALLLGAIKILKRIITNINLLCLNTERQTYSQTLAYPNCFKTKKNSSLTLFGKWVKDVVQLC